MRQRNIPITQKVAAQAQTDIKLVHDPVYYSTDDILSTSRVYSSIRQSHLLGPEGVLRPETDALLFSHLKNEIQLFKGVKSLEGISQEDLKKRLLWLEGQVEGMEKRELTLLGGDGVTTTGYYHVVSDLQAKLDRQTVINTNYEPKILQLAKRIEELEGEVARLREALLKEQAVKDQNEALKEAFRQVNEVARDPKKMRDFEKTVNSILVPLMDEVDVKLESFIKSTTVVGRAATTPQNRLKTQVNVLVKGLDRLLKSHEDFTIDNVENVVGNFLKDLDVYQTYEDYTQGKLYKHLYQDLKQKFTASVSLYKSSFQTAIKDHPELKSKINLSSVQSLQGDIDVITSGNMILLQPSWGKGRTVYYQTLQARTKNLISLMSRQFKRLLAKYPAIKTQLGAQLLEFLSLEVFDDAIALEEMERIVEVVKYQPEIVKVENVYQYNNDKNLKAIFHLRIMIKTLLEELLKLKDKTGAVLEIDEGLLGMIRAEIMDLVDTDDVLRVFRSVPKILQVQKIVEKDLGRYLGVLTQAHPLNIQSAKIVDRVVQKPVTVKDQVSLIVQKGVPTPVIHEKAVFMSQQRVIQVPVEKQVIVEKIITEQRPVQVDVIREVPIIQTEYQQVEKIVYKERLVEVPKEVTRQVPYETAKIVKEIVEIPRYEERLVEVFRDITNIKEVRLTQQVPMQITKYIELQKIVNNFIKVPQIVQIKQQIPITITNTIQKPVDVIQTIQKIVITKELQQKIIEVPVRHEVAIIQQVPMPYKEEVVVTTRGDTEEIIREVERIVEKPIIREVLKLREIQVEKAVPVWLREEKPVEIEVMVPYIQHEPEIISIQVEKFIPYREQVPVEVVREIPVPIVLQKQVIKQVRVMVQKIVQKLVQVPRVVQVQKIVQKIVVVPRVIQNIVHVPQLIEKIVEREVQVLKIVQLQKSVPIYLTNQVKQIVKQQTPYPVEKIVYQTVEKQKIVVMKEESQVIKEVEVERRIPVEVVVERDVPTIVEKIVEKLLTIRDVEIRDREVMMPYKHQEPVEIVQERAVEVRKIIENIIQVPQVIEKQVVLYETKIQPEIHTVYVEKPIEVQKEVVFTDTRNVIQKQIQYKQLIKQVLVKQLEKQEVLRPQPYIVEKVVYTNEIHEQGVQVRIEKGTPIMCDQFIQVQKPVNYFSSKQIPKPIYRDKLVQVRTIVDQLKQVFIAGPQKVVTTHSIKPQVVPITQQVIKYINQQVQKRVFTQVPIKQETIKLVEVPGKTKYLPQTQEVRVRESEPVYAEKIVERVILLPQIMEILKHVHDVTEIQQLGVAVGVDVDVHRRDYVQVCTGLKEGLDKLLLVLRGTGVKPAEMKAQIALIEELIPMIVELIKFPTIVQVPKQVEKIVEKERVVVIPTKNQDAIDREVASTTLIDKLVAQLKRLKDLFKVDLQLDDDIKNIFFAELKNIENLDLKLQQFTRVVLDRFHALGNWTSQHSLMLNSFLQERFLMAGIIKECNDNIEILKEDMDQEEAKSRKLNDVITKLNIHNITLKNALEEILQGLGRLSLQGTTNPAIKGVIDGLINRGKGSLDSAVSDPLRESRYVESHTQITSPDLQKLKAQNKLLQSQLQGYRGGQVKRNQYLVNQNRQLRADNDSIRSDLNKLRSQKPQSQPQTPEKAVYERKTQEQSRRIEQLSRQLHAQQEDYQRKLRNTKADFDKELQSRSRITETKEEDRLRMINKELEGRIGELEESLVGASNDYERLKFENSKLRVERDAARKRETEPEVRAGSQIQQEPTTVIERGGATSQQAPTRQSQLRTPRQLQHQQEQQKRTARGGTSQQSPDIRGGKLYTPADQLKFQSPELREVRTQQEPSEVQSSSSRLSGSQHLYQSQHQRSQQVRRNLTVRQLLNEGPLHQNIVAILIIKIVEKIQEETSRGRFMLYSPESIHLIGYSPDQPDQVKIKLGDPINKSNQQARLYLPPEVLRGEPSTQKSCIFNIGIIWDEMLHRQLYFHSTEQLQNMAYEYRVRNNRTNPIFKNSLFEMLSKDPRRRIAFTEIRRRLSLQQFIVLEEEGQQDIRRRL